MVPFAASWVVAAIAASSPADTGTPIIILLPAESQTASVAAAYLQNELELVLQLETASLDEPRALLARARSKWPSALIVLLHPDRNETWMSRPHEAEPVVRRLNHPPGSSAYPLAIAAAELVRNATAPKPLPPKPELELAFSVGLGISGSPGVERTLAQPVFGLELRLGTHGLWSSVGLRVRGPSSSNTDVGGNIFVDYSRTDLALQLGFGPELDRWHLALLVEAGLSVVSVDAQRGAELLGSNRRLPFWLGLGAQIRRPLFSGLGAVVCVELIRVLSPADFRGGPDIVFSEGDWRLQSQAALEWVL